MRLLGRASLAAYRLDLVFLRASLLADDRPEVNALVPEVDRILAKLADERAKIEAAEEAAVIASARRGRRDAALDRKVVSFGGQVRAVQRRLYDVLFRRVSPAQVARSGLDREVAEVSRILGELGSLPAEDALRVAHEKGLRDALDALVLARKESGDVELGLALARSKGDQLRAEADRVRVALHGKLQGLLESKAEADGFFRVGAARAEAAEPAAPVPADAT